MQRQDVDNQSQEGDQGENANEYGDAGEPRKRRRNRDPRTPAERRYRTPRLQPQRGHTTTAQPRTPAPTRPETEESRRRRSPIPGRPRQSRPQRKKFSSTELHGCSVRTPKPRRSTRERVAFGAIESPEPTGINPVPRRCAHCQSSPPPRHAGLHRRAQHRPTTPPRAGTRGSAQNPASREESEPRRRAGSTGARSGDSAPCNRTETPRTYGDQPNTVSTSNRRSGARSPSRGAQPRGPRVPRSTATRGYPRFSPDD